MSRRTNVSGALLAVASLAAACGGSTAGTTTTEPSTTVGTSRATTTTLPAQVEIPATGIVKFQPGTTYVATDFWTPLSFTTDEDGSWWALGATDQWVYVEYHQEGQSAWDLDLSVIVNDPDKSPDALVSDIRGDDRVEVTSDATTATVAGHDARVLDVVGIEVPEVAGVGGCQLSQGGNSRFQQLFPGLILLTYGDETLNPGLGGWIFGVRTCRAARIWVVDVDGDTIVIIAATRTQDLFDELIGEADAFVASIEFHP